MCLTKTQIEDVTLNSAVLNILQQFSLHFNNSHDKYQSIAYGIKEIINIQDHEDYPDVLLVKFSSQLSSQIFSMIILYRKCTSPYISLLETLRYFLQAKETHFITSDFNVNAFNKNTELQTTVSDFQQIVIVPIHIDGSILDYFYIRKSVFAEYCFNVVVINTYFTGHDVVQIKIQKRHIDFEVLA